MVICVTPLKTRLPGLDLWAALTGWVNVHLWLKERSPSPSPSTGKKNDAVGTHGKQDRVLGYSFKGEFEESCWVIKPRHLAQLIPDGETCKHVTYLKVRECKLMKNWLHS